MKQRDNRKLRFSKTCNVKIKQLEKDVMDLKIQQHTKKYIHIPLNWKKVGIFALTLLCGGLAYLNFLLIMFVGK